MFTAILARLATRRTAARFIVTTQNSRLHVRQNAIHDLLCRKVAGRHLNRRGASLTGLNRDDQDGKSHRCRNCRNDKTIHCLLLIRVCLHRASGWHLARSTAKKYFLSKGESSCFCFPRNRGQMSGRTPLPSIFHRPSIAAPPTSRTVRSGFARYRCHPHFE